MQVEVKLLIWVFRSMSLVTLQIFSYTIKGLLLSLVEVLFALSQYLGVTVLTNVSYLACLREIFNIFTRLLGLSLIYVGILHLKLLANELRAFFYTWRCFLTIPFTLFNNQDLLKLGLTSFILQRIQVYGSLNWSLNLKFRWFLTILRYLLCRRLYLIILL